MKFRSQSIRIPGRCISGRQETECGFGLRSWCTCLTLPKSCTSLKAKFDKTNPTTSRRVKVAAVIRQRSRRNRLARIDSPSGLETDLRNDRLVVPRVAPVVLFQVPVGLE